MGSLELSRWPNLKIGQPPDGCVRAFVLESGAVPDDIIEMGRRLGLDLVQDSGKDEIKSGKDNGIPVVFMLIHSSSLGNLPMQRNILNRLATKFSTHDFRPFRLCAFNVLTPKFKVECLETLLSSLYEFSVFKEEKIGIKEIWISGLSSDDEARVVAINSLFSWVCFARDLVNYPPSDKPPVELARVIYNQMSNLNIQITTFSEPEIKMSFDPVWKVGQASNNKPVLLRLEYKPEGAKNPKPIVIVGKGVVYDVGGHNIKTDGPDLKIMKMDMAGAAAAVSICGSAASLGLPVHLIVYLPLVENMIGPEGLKPGDIVRIPAVREPKEKDDWYFIEVTDTDAEGRLLLSSVVGHAALNDNPEFIITLATLCGTTESMLGYLVAGAMSRTKSLLDEIESAGRVTGETYATVRISPDVFEEYLGDYESTIADYQNSNWNIVIGDSLQAFCLINRFADKVPFLHLDICGTAYLPWAIVKKSKRSLPEGATGWGVASVTELLRRYVKNQPASEPA